MMRSKELLRKGEAYEKEREKLNKRLKRSKDKNGVPEIEYNKLQAAYENLNNELNQYKKLISRREKETLDDKKTIQQLETEKIQLSNYLKRKDEDINKYLSKLKEKKTHEKKVK